MVGIGAAVFRYRMFDSSPAVGAIGKERIVQETEDIVFVIDRDEHIITLNASAVDTLGITRNEALGKPLETVFGHSITDLSEQADVSVDTVDGTRQYDSELSTLTDQHDQLLGTMVSLRDVTERNLREQRLTVLNRTLRHNLRNRVDVLKSHVEVLDIPEEDTHHYETVMDEADSLIDIARRTRSIDRFIDASTESTRVDIRATVERRLERMRTEQQEVTVSLEFPEMTTVVTNREALEAALERAIENAITHADTTVTIQCDRRADSIEITISDDGPGIPEHELEVIEAGEETPLTHGTGMGLWQLKWAVMAMNGQLSIESTDGTTVTIHIPDLPNGYRD